MANTAENALSDLRKKIKVESEHIGDAKSNKTDINFPEYDSSVIHKVRTFD